MLPLQSLLILLGSLVIVIAQDPYPCRFAPLYSQDDLLFNDTARIEFLKSVMYWEGKFNSDGAGLNAASGFVYDGHQLDYTTGELADPLHYWSAPSKESIQLGLIARAMTPDERQELALQFFHVPLPEAVAMRSRWNSGDSRVDTILTILENKISTYEKFNQEYPGYGGFLPWVYVNDSGIIPIPHEWDDKVPGLDNGEMIWGIFAVYHALIKNASYTELALRYKRYFDLLAENSVTVFWDGTGIRAVSLIRDIKAQPTPDNYYTQQPCNGCYLDDPYEGELFAFFMDLYGLWPNPADREKIWIMKRARLQAVDLQTPSGPITVQRGWWFSSHEQWKYLMLPYVQVPINKRVFINGERARSWNSHMKKYAGLFASVTNVTTPGVPPNYASATGIQEIAFEEVIENDVVTPYGAFPLFLATDESIGLLWYHNMLMGPSMQNPYGSTESVNLSGALICPVITWDSKITTVLAMLGGVYDINLLGLSADEKFSRFYHIVDREWSMVFKDLHGENLSFMAPIITIPTNKLGDFTSCKSA